MELYAEGGVTFAARETGVPAGTVKSWASRGHEVTPRAEQQRARIEAIQRSAEERRAVLLDKLGQVAELGVDWAKSLLESGDDLAMRDVVGAWTRAIHDLQLLSGEATSRSETVSVDSPIDEKVDELLAARQRRGAA